MKQFRYKKDWDDFNVLPTQDELLAELNLPRLDDNLACILEKLEHSLLPKDAMSCTIELMKISISRIESGVYNPVQVESIFRFACQVARFSGVFLEEYCKSDETLNFFFRASYDISSFFEELTSLDKTGEMRLVMEAVINREALIQKFSTKTFDYRTEYVYIAKLLKDARLKGYLLSALKFYQSVPEDELLFDRETDLENIIDALGNPGWDEFVPFIEKYFHSQDDIIRLAAINSIGKIGGEKAAAALKKLRMQYLEGFVEIDPAASAALDLNIIFAEQGYALVIAEATKKGTPWWRTHAAIRIVAGIKDQIVIKFLFSLLDDEHIEEAEVQYNNGEETFTRAEVHFPVREEAMAALENYDENYVVSIAGEKYRHKRDYFFQDLEKLFHKKRWELFGEGERFEY